MRLTLALIVSVNHWSKLRGIMVVHRLVILRRTIIDNRPPSASVSASKKKDDADKTNNGINKAMRTALDGVLANIEITYGRGSTMQLGDADSIRCDLY